MSNSSKSSAEPNYFKMVNNAFEISKQLGPMAFAVFAYLWRRQSGNETCWPGHKNISETLGISVRSSTIAVRKLVDAGVVEKQRRPNTSNLYTVVKYIPESAKSALLHDSEAQNLRVGSAEFALPEVQNLRTKKIQRDLDPEEVNQTPSSAFDVWWEAYGNKVAKKEARRAYPAAVKAFARQFDLALSEADEALLAKTLEWKRNVMNPTHPPHPATWLRGERWNDEPKKTHRRVQGSDGTLNGHLERELLETATDVNDASTTSILDFKPV